MWILEAGAQMPDSRPVLQFPLPCFCGGERGSSVGVWMKQPVSGEKVQLKRVWMAAQAPAVALVLGKRALWKLTSLTVPGIRESLCPPPYSPTTHMERRWQGLWQAPPLPASKSLRRQRGPALPRHRGVGEPPPHTHTHGCMSALALETLKGRPDSPLQAAVPNLP